MSNNLSLKTKQERLQMAINKLERLTQMPATTIVDSKYRIQYAKVLNPAQLQAVCKTEGHTLVIAGAGSGKTRVLTYRVSFLLENNVPADNILLLTFTRKSALEIKQRVTDLLNDHSAHHITSGTFHGFCHMLLSRYSQLLNLQANFTVLDQTDAMDALDLIKKDMKISPKNGLKFPKKITLYKILSTSKNNVIPPQKLIETNYPDLINYSNEIIQLFDQYETYKKSNHLYDYDDLIQVVNVHLENNIEFKTLLQNRYRHIMVDEYQDTNLPQKKLIDFLAEKPDCALMVVGDDNQSIYAFRGANYENILLFGETYPQAALIKLEQNYRSTPNILNFINAVSNHMTLSYKKKLFSEQKDMGLKPTYSRLLNEQQEAYWIAEKIARYKGQMPYKNIAILFRAAYQSNFVQVELMKRDIPFNMVGGIKFIEKRHIKDILAYFRVLWNPSDYISWNRILLLLKGIGPAAVKRLIQKISHENQGYLALKKSSYFKQAVIQDLYTLFEKIEKRTSLIEIFDYIEAYYTEQLKTLEDDWRNRLEDFKILKQLCLKQTTLEVFLADLALNPPNEIKAVSDHADLADSVTLSTIHSAKGLEWETVFVISLLDGQTPHHKALNNPEQLEEERKLFYVACSRAEKRLHLTSPYHAATYTNFFDQPSQFLTELDPNVLDWQNKDDQLGSVYF